MAKVKGLDKGNKLGLLAVIGFVILTALIYYIAPMVTSDIITVQVAATSAFLIALAITIARIIEDLIDDYIPDYGMIVEMLIVLVLAYFILGWALGTMGITALTFKLAVMVLAVVSGGITSVIAKAMKVSA